MIELGRKIRAQLFLRRLGILHAHADLRRARLNRAHRLENFARIRIRLTRREDEHFPLLPAAHFRQN